MTEVVKCMIVDDEPLAIELLQAHISQIPQLEIIASTSNPIEAIGVLKSTSIDLLFLDIQMPILTGIELLKTLSHPPSVILTTAFREYAVESYELNVIDYLVKPITFIRFLKAVNKYLEGGDSQQPSPIQTIASTDGGQDYLFVNVNKRYVRVVFSKILYVESVKDYVHIHTDDQTIITKDKISDFAAKLSDRFIRIHRSFIVNRSKITAFTAQDIEIGDKEIPIGQSYKTKVLDLLR